MQIQHWTTFLPVMMPVINVRGCGGLTSRAKNRPGSATPERVQVQPDNDLSIFNYTTPSQPAQASVFDRLPQGEENAIQAKELARQCGFKGARDLQHAIALERETGALILSTCRHGGGYYRPADGEAGKREINAFVGTLASRALNTLKAIKAARRELKTIDGQVTIDQIETALMAVVNAHDDGNG